MDLKFLDETGFQQNRDLSLAQQVSDEVKTNQKYRNIFNLFI